MHNLTINEDKWYIAHNSADIVHFGYVVAGQQFTTSQPELEFFFNEDDWRARITELGGYP